MRLSSLALLLGLALTSCDKAGHEDIGAEPFVLPEAISNNAAALAAGKDGVTLYSFNGLAAGKSWADARNIAFACPIQRRRCRAIADVPGPEGRLASVAVTLGEDIYIFGGYSVAEDGSEKSLPYVHRFDPMTESYTRLANMPVPVDDSVALPYMDRYIYLVSGWHDIGNVSLVQVYDSQTDSWFGASDYPGAPVFGHAGGIVGNSLVIADGVLVRDEPDSPKYGPSDEVWRGDIDPDNPAIIRWRRVKAHPGKPLYRMAAAGNATLEQVIFAGGSDNPYNYDGIGYDDIPSEPSSALFGYDVNTDQWTQFAPLSKASMDHRALIFDHENAYIMGGMRRGQETHADITQLGLKELSAAEE